MRIVGGRQAFAIDLDLGDGRALVGPDRAHHDFLADAQRRLEDEGHRCRLLPGLDRLPKLAIPFAADPKLMAARAGLELEDPV